MCARAKHKRSRECFTPVLKSLHEVIETDTEKTRRSNSKFLDGDSLSTAL